MINIGFNTKPQEAYEFMKSKKPSLDIDFKTLSNEARAKAFTINKLANMDMLKDMQGSISDALKNGTPFNVWKKNITNHLSSKGWLSDDLKAPHRLKTIFMTNTRTAYSVGRYKAQIQLKDSVYWRYVGILDTKIRSSHSKQHGIIKHRGDPFWQSHYPPNAYNCRCKVQAYRKDELEDRGWSESQDEIPAFADKSFNYNIGEAHKQELEAYHYKKSLKYLNDCKKENNAKGKECLGRVAFKQTIKEIAQNQELNKDFNNFIEKIDKDIKHKQNKIVAGVINIEVFDYFFKKTNNQIEKPHIYFDKKSFTHMTRKLKQDKGIALSIYEIKNIPNAIKEPDMIVWDNKENAILYISNTSEKANKIAVKINYIMKDKSIYNYVKTTSKQAYKDIEALIKGGVYDVIK